MNWLFKRFGLSIRFDAVAPVGDTGTPDVTGGTPDPSKAGGGSLVAKPESYTLNIDGESKVVTLEEMKTLATKAGGADKRFQEASEMKKQAEKGLKIGNLIDSMADNPTDEQAKELALHLGIDPGEFMAYLNENETPQGGDKGNKPAEAVRVSKQDIIDAMGFDPEKAKVTLERSETRQIEDAKKNLREISDLAVDKDEIFGKMIIGDKRDDRMSIIKDEVAEDVLRKIQDGVPYGAELVAGCVQKIRAKYTKFGIPSTPDQFPIVLGMGPGGGLSAEIQADKPIERVAAGKDGDEDNLVSRYLQKGIQLIRKQSHN